MSKSATDVMQEVISAAVLDSLAALKAASRGLPNTLLRDIGAIHANTTFADLPDEVQRSITASVRAAFTRLLKEGYSVSPASAPTPQWSVARRDGPPRSRSPGRPGQGKGGGKPPPKGRGKGPGPRNR